jgi:hypothetical protein
VWWCVAAGDRGVHPAVKEPFGLLLTEPAVARTTAVEATSEGVSGQRHVCMSFQQFAPLRKSQSDLSAMTGQHETSKAGREENPCSLQGLASLAALQAMAALVDERFVAGFGAARIALTDSAGCSPSQSLPVAPLPIPPGQRQPPLLPAGSVCPQQLGLRSRAQGVGMGGWRSRFTRPSASSHRSSARSRSHALGQANRLLSPSSFLLFQGEVEWPGCCAFSSRDQEAREGAQSRRFSTLPPGADSGARLACFG